MIGQERQGSVVARRLRADLTVNEEEPSMVQHEPRVTVAALLLAGALLATMTGVAAGAEPQGYQRPGTTERVSVASDGTEPDDDSHWPTISPDGRHVAFMSYATTLVPEVTEGGAQVYVRDQGTGTTELVSVSSDGAPGNRSSTRPALSADGRYVAFHSSATNLVPGPLRSDGEFHVGNQHVYVYDRQAETMERVSVSPQEELGDRPSWEPVISWDGRFVAFMSDAANLVPDDTNDQRDVFVHDRETGVTERVSVATDGTEGNDGSWVPDISADGRYVAFDSQASTLVEDKSNTQWDVFVHDRETGTTERVSVASDGTEGNLHSLNAAISADGRHVAFNSRANNLVPTDTNRRTMLEVFVHDREAGTTERVSVTWEGGQGDAESRFPDISADGRYVSFDSVATNLVPGITNDCESGGGTPIGDIVTTIEELAGLSRPHSCFDVFVHDRHTGATERVSVADDGTEGDDRSWYHALSADGRLVAFTTDAHNLVPSTTDDSGDILLRDRGPTVGVGGLDADQVDGAIEVSGWATFAGAVLTSADDPVGDAQDVGPLSADELGAEITGTSISFRPEQRDLLLRLGLSHLPAAGDESIPVLTLEDPVGAGAPGVLYAFGFELDDTRYEVRVIRASATTDPPTAEPHLALYACADACERIARLDGGIGTTGVEVRTAIPLALLGPRPQATLTDVVAWAALGEADESTLEVLDDVGLSDTTIPSVGVELGIAPATTPAEEVEFTTTAGLLEGRFSGTLDATGLSAGDYTVWARACVGDACGVRAVSVRL